MDKAQISHFQHLAENWKGTLELEGANPISERYREWVTAQLLENTLHDMTGKTSDNLKESDDNALLEASSTPVNVQGNHSYYDPVLLSMVRRATPNMIAHDLTGVQPMTGPTGQIFSLRPKYVRGGNLDTDAFYNEADTDHSGTGTHAGDDPTTLLQASPGAYTRGTGLDVSDGELLGTDSGNAWNEMGFEIDKFSVEAKTRALKAQYTHELAQDLQNIHRTDVESELTNIVGTEILAEINREVLRLIYVVSKIGAQKWTTNAGWIDLETDTDGRWSAERYQGLINLMNFEANRIAIETRRGTGNVMVCDTDTASILDAAGRLDTTVATGGLNVDATGNLFAGMFNNRYRVYVDPYATGNFFVMGYKGASAWDAGIYYCPYVPLQMYKATGEDSFQPRFGFKTRYGLKANPFAEGTTKGNGALNANSNIYYRKVGIKNLNVTG